MTHIHTLISAHTWGPD